jgi:predicted RNase H-like HicB family nuclease
LEQCFETVRAQGRGSAVKYAVIFEKAPNNYSAYVPDLPGCIATGGTQQEVERNIREAIAFHLEGLRLENEPVPEPSTWTELVEA